MYFIRMVRIYIPLYYTYIYWWALYFYTYVVVFVVVFFLRNIFWNFISSATPQKTINNEMHYNKLLTLTIFYLYFFFVFTFLTMLCIHCKWTYKRIYNTHLYISRDVNTNKLGRSIFYTRRVSDFTYLYTAQEEELLNSLLLCLLASFEYRAINTRTNSDSTPIELERLKII